MVKTFTPEQQSYILKLYKGGTKPELIASQFQRSFRPDFATPSDVQAFIKLALEQQAKRNIAVDKIKDEVTSHDQELKWARSLLKQKMEDGDLSAHQLVELAGEFRKNVLSSQEVARLADSRGNFQFVLQYGDEVVKRSHVSEDIQDAEFTPDEQEED